MPRSRFLALFCLPIFGCVSTEGDIRGAQPFSSDSPRKKALQAYQSVEKLSLFKEWKGDVALSLKDSDTAIRLWNDVLKSVGAVGEAPDKAGLGDSKVEDARSKAVDQAKKFADSLKKVKTTLAEYKTGKKDSKQVDTELKALRESLKSSKEKLNALDKEVSELLKRLQTKLTAEGQDDKPLLQKLSQAEADLKKCAEEYEEAQAEVLKFSAEKQKEILKPDSDKNKIAEWERKMDEAQAKADRLKTEFEAKEKALSEAVAALDKEIAESLLALVGWDVWKNE